MKNSVLVLLTTYNGEKYLKEQLESILNQENVKVFIKIADDGSKDKTISILNNYSRKYKNIVYSINKVNKGFTYNFIDLIFSCSNESYDYYALADQDDVWLSNKLSSAIKILKNRKSAKGSLYCSNLDVVDKNLNFMHKLESKKSLSLDKFCPLSRNITTGCTIVFNKPFLHQILKHYPKNIYLHDWWLSLIAIYTADFYYDFNSYIRYRQHVNNLIGEKKTNLNLFKKIKNFIKFDDRKSTSHLISEFYELYKDEISDKNLFNIVTTYKKSIKSKLKLFFSKSSIPKNRKIRFKIRILFNRF